MAFRYSTKLFNDILSTVKSDLTNGSIELYTGSQPSSPDSAVTGTLIGRVTVNGGAWTEGSGANGLNFGTVAAGAVDKSTSETWQFTAIAAGTIGWGRFRANATDAGAADGTFVNARIDFSVGITTGDMKMSKVTYAVGETGVIQEFLIPLSNIS
jgi:hypothetical protein